MRRRNAFRQKLLTLTEWLIPLSSMGAENGRT